MPELPDLLHIQAKLEERLRGRTVTSERLRSPVILRALVRGNLSLLLGRKLDEVRRRSHFLVFRFEGLDLAVNPMLAGRFRLAAAENKDEASLAFALGFEEAGEIDILSPRFTRERFVSLLKHRRDQVRAFLLDKKALDSLGNAYADEVLFAAGIHPKTWCRSLSHDDAVRLHDAIVEVMKQAVAEVARRDEPIEVKVRDFLKVRMKDECPRCGSKLRKAGVRGMDAYFCPRCQPATRSGLVDWTKTGK